MACENPEAHEAHMEVNGECPWCGAYDESRTEFGHIDDDGNVYDRHGRLIEESGR